MSKTLVIPPEIIRNFYILNQPVDLMNQKVFTSLKMESFKPFTSFP